jgi:Protein of unknown function (DUF2490)
LKIKHFLLTSFLILIASNISVSQILTTQVTDNQSWNDVQIAVPITSKLNGIFSGTLRFGRNFRRPVDERIGFQISYKANKYFTLASGIVYRAAQPTATRKIIETRLIESITANLPIKKYSLSNRNTYEFHLINSRADVWWYRNKTQIERDIKIGKTKIKPFAYAEFFYNGTQKRWFRGRFVGGISKKFNKNLTLDIFYMRQQEGKSNPARINAIGTTWKINL